MSNNLIPTLDEFQYDPIRAIIHYELIYLVTLFITSGASFMLGFIIGWIWAMAI
jgi:hypothetical protein